jgi:hypothetical protein
VDERICCDLIRRGSWDDRSARRCCGGTADAKRLPIDGEDGEKDGRVELLQYGRKKSRAE